MKKFLLLLMMSVLVIGIYPWKEAEAATYKIDLYMYKGDISVETRGGVTLEWLPQKVNVSFIVDNPGANMTYMYEVFRDGKQVYSWGSTKATSMFETFITPGTYSFKVTCATSWGAPKECSGKGKVELIR